MEQWFCRMADLTLSGSIAILGVLVFRQMLRNQPKIFSYLLWIIVGVRLVLPVPFVGVCGMLPMPEFDMASSGKSHAEESGGNNDAKSGGNVGRPDDMGQVLPIENGQPGQPSHGMDHVESYDRDHPIEMHRGGLAGLMARHHVLRMLFLAWIAGVAMLAAKNILSYVRLKKRVQVSMREGEYYLSDHISGAFVLGLARPRIYLSSSLMAEERGFILAHEKVHLRRRDYLWKCLAECILCAYWFNPLAWIAFRKFAADMEMSCDEAVLRRECQDGRMAYARALLVEMAESREKGLVPFFCREGAERRIYNMMKIKNLSKKRAAVCAGVVLAAAALLLPGFWKGGMFGKAAEERQAEVVKVQDEDAVEDQDGQIVEERLVTAYHVDDGSEDANKMKGAVNNSEGREYGYPTSHYIYSFEGDVTVAERGEIEAAAQMVTDDISYRLGGKLKKLVYNEKKSNDLAKKHGCDLAFTVDLKMPKGDGGKSRTYSGKNCFLSKGADGGWQIENIQLESR